MGDCSGKRHHSAFGCSEESCSGEATAVGMINHQHDQSKGTNRSNRDAVLVGATWRHSESSASNENVYEYLNFVINVGIMTELLLMRVGWKATAMAYALSLHAKSPVGRPCTTRSFSGTP